MNGEPSRQDTVEIGPVEHQTVELVPGSGRMPDPPVFADASGRRRRWLTYLAIGNGGVLLVALVALIVGLGGTKNLPLPALPKASAATHPGQRSASPRADSTSVAPSPAKQVASTPTAPATTATPPATAAASPTTRHGNGPTSHPGNGHGKG